MIKFKVLVRFKGDNTLRCVDTTYRVESANNVLDAYIANCSVDDYQIVKVEETIVRKKICAK